MNVSPSSKYNLGWGTDKQGFVVVDVNQVDSGEKAEKMDPRDPRD